MGLIRTIGNYQTDRHQRPIERVPDQTCPALDRNEFP